MRFTPKELERVVWLARALIWARDGEDEEDEDPEELEADGARQPAP